MRRPLLVLAALAAAWLALPAARAASLRSDIQFLFPREAGEVAFLDLVSLRASPHYFVLKQRLLPPRFAQFEHFVRTIGVEPDKDLQWLAWVLVPPAPDRPGEQFLGLAEGSFEPERVEELFRREKRPTDLYRGQTVFPMGATGEPTDLVFTFLDSSTAAFGTRAGIELLLETRFGAHENLLHNETLLARVQEVNGHAPVWMALDDTYTRLAVRQLVPEAAKFPEFDPLIDRFRSGLIRLTVERELTAHFSAWCAEPLDAESIALLLQTAFTAQSWQTQKTNPALSAVLASAAVSTAGERVEIQVDVGEKDLRALLEQARSFLP